METLEALGRARREGEGWRAMLTLEAAFTAALAWRQHGETIDRRGHHLHRHDPMQVGPHSHWHHHDPMQIGPHSHWHHHEPMQQTHAHVPDAHHQHAHEA